MADLIFYIQNPKCMNLSDPGTGKTPSVCVNQYRRFGMNGDRTTWVQPKSLLRKNREEILRFTNFHPHQVAIVDGTKSQIDKAMSSEASVLLMGPARYKLVRKDIPKANTALDVDEMHMCFGGGTSAATREFLEGARTAKESVIMSGTLVNGRLDSAWPAIHAINPRYYPLGLPQFMAAHALIDDYGKVMFWKNHDKLAKIFGRHGIRRTFESIFGKQEVVIQTRKVELSEKQRARYDEFEERALIELEDLIIDGIEGATLIRARQIMEHPRDFHDPREKGARIDIVDGELTGKEESILIDLEDHKRTGMPLIIFAALKPQQKALLKLVRDAGLSAVLMDSETTGAQRAQIDADFKAGKYQVLIGSSQIASVGFNWQFWGPARIEVQHVVFASTNHMDGDFIQAYRRTIREKRKTPLRVTVLQYDAPVEIGIHRNVCRKSRDANKVHPDREVLEFA